MRSSSPRFVLPNAMCYKDARAVSESNCDVEDELDSFEYIIFFLMTHYLNGNKGTSDEEVYLCTMLYTVFFLIYNYVTFIVSLTSYQPSQFTQ